MCSMESGHCLPMVSATFLVGGRGDSEPAAVQSIKADVHGTQPTEAVTWQNLSFITKAQKADLSLKSAVQWTYSCTALCLFCDTW